MHKLNFLLIGLVVICSSAFTTISNLKTNIVDGCTVSASDISIKGFPVFQKIDKNALPASNGVQRKIEAVGAEPVEIRSIGKDEITLDQDMITRFVVRGGELKIKNTSLRNGMLIKEVYKAIGCEMPEEVQPTYTINLDNAEASIQVVAIEGKISTMTMVKSN